VPIAPKHALDWERFRATLGQITAETEALRHDVAESGEIVLHGLGELELERAIERLQQEFQLEIVSGAPNIAYRETIRHSFISQCAENAAALELGFEPSGSHSDCSFVDRTVDSTPSESIFGAVRRGLEHAFQIGPIGAGPVVGVRTTLLDAAFPGGLNAETIERIAASCWQKATGHLTVSILEPMMRVTVRCPTSDRDVVLSDLNSRRAAILAEATADDELVVSVSAPLANLFGYVNTLRSMTQGHSTYEMLFERYQLVPNVLPPDSTAF